jgi:hypothetical protein
VADLLSTVQYWSLRVEPLRVEQGGLWYTFCSTIHINCLHATAICYCSLLSQCTARATQPAPRMSPHAALAYATQVPLPTRAGKLGLQNPKTAATPKVPPKRAKAKHQAAEVPEPQSSQGSNAWPEDRW